MTNYKIKIDPSLDEQQLIDQEVIHRFAKYCEIQPEETVLEIGPGVGNITEVLLDTARYLICIEKNPKYIPLLIDRFKESSNLKVVQDDALKTYLPKHDRLVSNLPYMIVEAFFQRTLRLEFNSATFIVPTRFSKTIQAKLSEPEYSKLSFLSQLFYDIFYRETVPPESYLPQPGVSTAIITLKPRQASQPSEETLKELGRQGDKYTKNALREALIRADVCSSKKEARILIERLRLEPRVLQKWVSRLSLSDLQYIHKELVKKITG